MARFQSVLVGSWSEKQTLQLVVALQWAYHMGGLQTPILQHQHNLEPSPDMVEYGTSLGACQDGRDGRAHLRAVPLSW